MSYNYDADLTLSSEKLIASQMKNTLYSTIDVGGKANIPYYSSLATGITIEAGASIYVDGINIYDETDLYVPDSSVPMPSFMLSQQEAAVAGAYTYFRDKGRNSMTLGNYIVGNYRLEVLMGNEYLINNKNEGGIYLLTRNGTMADSAVKIVDTRGKQYVCNNQLMLIFYDKYDRCLYSFQSDYVLQKIADVSQLDAIYGGAYDFQENKAYLFSGTIGATTNKLYAFDNGVIEEVPISYELPYNYTQCNGSLMFFDGANATNYTIARPLDNDVLSNSEVIPIDVATTYYGIHGGEHIDQKYIFEFKWITGDTAPVVTIKRSYFTVDGIQTDETQAYTLSFDAKGYAYIRYQPDVGRCYGSAVSVTIAGKTANDTAMLSNVYQYVTPDGQLLPVNQ